jgi:hypothetical protein
MSHIRRASNVIISIKVEVGLDREATAIMNGIRNELTNIATALEANMATFQELVDQVTRNTDIEASAVVAINGIAARLQDLINNGVTPEQLQTEVDRLRASVDPLAAAVAANTEVPPTP